MVTFKKNLTSIPGENPYKRRKLDEERVMMSERPKRSIKQTKFFDNSDTILKGVEATTPETK